MTQPMTAEEHQAATEREYSQYVADGVIFIGGARAFNDGDPVPASHVERGVLREDQVRPAPEPAVGEPAAAAPAADATPTKKG